MTSTERQIWINGRRGSIVCVTATIYERQIVASAEADQITPQMMEKALRRDFPHHTFYIRNERFYFVASADRWTGDGIEEGDATE